jgi:serine/threonine protein phosphatase 1
LSKSALSQVRRFTRNTAGRDLVVGDVHGCFTKLQAALDAVGFNHGAGDRLFSVGDLVDRGPESAQALAWLDRLHAVKGNHEAMALDYAAGSCDGGLYAANGGAWFIGMTPPERLPFIDAFGALPVAIEVETAHGLVGLVHADCPLADWRDFTDLLLTGEGFEADHVRDMAMWSRRRVEQGDRSDVKGVAVVVVGHTVVNAIAALGNVLFLDTGAWMSGGESPQAFGIIDLATMGPAVAPVVNAAPELLAML